MGEATESEGGLHGARYRINPDRIEAGTFLMAGAITRVVANIDGVIDRYLVDGAVNFVAGSTLSAGRILRRVQTGRIQTYLYGALVGAIALVLFNFLIK